MKYFSRLYLNLLILFLTTCLKLRIWWSVNRLKNHYRMTYIGPFYYWRLYNVDPKGWCFRITKVLRISRYGNKKYIEANKGYRYNIVILGKHYWP